MRGIVRLVVPASLIFWGLALLPELHAGFRLLNHDDLPGAYISLVMIALLIPAGLSAILSPKWGGVALAAIGALGVLGKLLTPTFYQRPIAVGLVPLMFLIACADGVFLSLNVADSIKRN